jgi:tetratricopeptide (TPR) repeat protein
MTARDGATLWSFSTEREARDVFTVQRAILDSIVRLLKPQLLSRVGPALSRQTTDLQAHDLVLEGRYRAQTNTRAGLMRSVELFNQALARDPGYALAYVSLAESYSLLGDGYVAPSEMLPNSFAATERALALDSTLGEAWSKRCENDLYQWNWARAKTDLDRAQVLNPNDLEALYCETYYWVAMRRPGQAVAAARKSAALDPLAPGTRQSLAFAFLLAGEPDSAIAWSLAATKLQPGYAYVDAVDGYAYAATGRIAEAERAFRQAEPLLGHRSPGLAYVLALADRHAEAREVVRDIERDWGTHYVVPTFLATAYLALGDTGKMYEWLESGVDLHSAFAWYNGLWPPFRNIREEPHFKAILRRQNLIP